MIFTAGTTNNSIDVQIVDDTGLPVLLLVAGTFPVVKYSVAGAHADVTITLSNLASLAAAHTDGGVFERGGGFYRLDLPDVIFAAVGNHVTIRGETTGKHIMCPPLDVQDVLTSVISSAYASPTAGYALYRLLSLPLASTINTDTDLVSEDEVVTIVAYLGEVFTPPTQTITVNGAAIDLSGRDLALMCQREDSSTKLWQLLSDDGELVVGGILNNELTIIGTKTETAVAGTFWLNLRDVTGSADSVIAVFRLEVRNFVDYSA